MIQPSRDSSPHSAGSGPGRRRCWSAHSTESDSCYKDYARTNAQDLMDLVTQIGADVEPPPPPKPAATD